MSDLVWSFRDEYHLLVRLPRGCFDAYVNAALCRALDFTGQPTTPEWEATYLEWVADARIERARREHQKIAWKDA